MAMVEWDDAYSVEIQEIDEQHKHLIQLMNELYSALAQKNNRDEVGQILDKLFEYTKVHFAVEETLMRIFGYEGYAEHKQHHSDIVSQLVYYHQKFVNGDNSVGIELLMLLKDWLFDHITNVDKQYSKTFHKAGVKKSRRKLW